ncbi:MAG: nucleotidyltransferase [Bacteroidota bacterium]
MNEILSLAHRQATSAVLERLARSIDLTDQQYRDAIERYEAVGRFLSDPTGSLAIYNPRLVPQGSFRIGTVIRPDHEECEFDVDTTCWLMINLPDSQFRVKQLIAHRLNTDANYRRMLKEKHRCWRLVYSETTRFHLDIVPAIPDNYDMLVRMGVPERYAKHAIRITDNRHPNYHHYTMEWMGSNPEGYALWFLDIMKIQADQIRSVLSAELKMSMDKIPEYKVRTPLQRGIQLMKRHRDQMFGDDDLKPISIIINTLAALAYAEVMRNPHSGLFFDIIYSMIEKMPSYIEIRNGKKWITNPVNPDENFADKWVLDKRLEDNFFKWHSAFLNLLRNDKLGRDGDVVARELKLSFGERTVNRAFSVGAMLKNPAISSPFTTAATLLASGGAYTNEYGHITATPNAVPNQPHRFHFSHPPLIPRRHDHKFGYLKFQQHLIEKHYKFLKCRIENKVLKCTGQVTPIGSVRAYKVLIEYVVGKEPKVTILSSDIKPSYKIHMYKDRSLCLSYPPDMRWTERSNIAELTIPWLAEWLVYYELYLVNGNIWQGPQSPAHLTEATRNINVDED